MQDSEIKYLTNKVAALMAKVETYAADMKDLLKKGGDWTVNEEGNFEGKADLFFAPGKPLSLRRAFQIAKVAPKIKGYGSIQVMGHTDITPLVKTKKVWATTKPSAARAVSVARALIKAGVPAPKVSSYYGEYKPAVPGKTKKELSRNRRVEIKILK